MDGILCICYETSSRVIAEGRMRTLRDLGRARAMARTPEEACQSAAEVLAANSIRGRRATCASLSGAKSCRSVSVIRALLADDHVLVRDGLKRLLADQPDIFVVAEAANGTRRCGSRRSIHRMWPWWTSACPGGMASRWPES